MFLEILKLAAVPLVSGFVQKRVPNVPTGPIPLVGAGAATAVAAATGLSEGTGAVELGILASALATALHQVVKIFIRWSFPKIGLKVPEKI